MTAADNGFGLGLELPISGADATPENLLTVAKEAERIGLAAVWTFERLLRPSGSAVLPERYGSVFDPLETLAYVAAATSRIGLGISVINALLHSPLVLARRLATLDRLSGDRVMVGLSQGWLEEEFTATGVPMTSRGRRFEEHIAVMWAVWGADPVECEGRFHRIPSSSIGPKPVRPGGPVLLAGAASPSSIARAARLGLGLNPIMMSWELLETTIATHRDAAQAAGHVPGSQPIVLRVNGTITTSAGSDRAPLTGTVEQVNEDLARANGLGVSHVFWAMESPLEDQLAAMERLVDVVRSSA